MIPSGTLGFAAGAVISAGLGGLVLALAVPSLAPGAGGWAAAACVATALPGVVVGTRLANIHGRAGSSFVVIVGLGLLLRLTLSAVVASMAARASGAAVPAALAGLAAGFVPITVFETVWFAQRTAAGPRPGWRG